MIDTIKSEYDEGLERIYADFQQHIVNLLCGAGDYIWLYNEGKEVGKSKFDFYTDDDLVHELLPKDYPLNCIRIKSKIKSDDFFKQSYINKIDEIRIYQSYADYEYRDENSPNHTQYLIYNKKLLNAYISQENTIDLILDIAKLNDMHKQAGLFI